eukprot:scaffold30032_cov138-Isochrysis_galbana.AAC.7
MVPGCFACPSFTPFGLLAIAGTREEKSCRSYDLRRVSSGAQAASHSRRATGSMGTAFGISLLGLLPCLFGVVSDMPKRAGEQWLKSPQCRVAPFWSFT